MQIYLVGGAVRDTLLGLPIREKDYVVVGATPQEMTNQGFKPVGRDFPVFLHPRTHEEHALARTERKISAGHQGFSFYADPKVTLEEDLKRRDLTINAMAQDDHGNIIDPYHGKQDLQDRILRHVSPAFSEDPLRILRVARFAAYLGQFDFKIAPETLSLMQKIVAENALAELSDERIWQEIYRALQTDYPEKFFEVLQTIGAIPHLFKGSLDSRLRGNDNPLIRFAVLCKDAQYLRPAPKEFADLAELVRTKTPEAMQFKRINAEEKVHFLRSLDYLRRPERLDLWISASKMVDSNFPAQDIQQASTALRGLNREAIAKQATNIAEAIFQAECKALTALAELPLGK